jgi:acyl dehydratase
MTGAIMMRMLVDHFLSPASSMGSPGLDELRWIRPVRPGDTLRVRVAVIEARRSQNKPDRGILLVQQECLNQNDEVVMSSKSMSLCRCRNAEPG